MRFLIAKRTGLWMIYRYTLDSDGALVPEFTGSCCLSLSEAWGICEAKLKRYRKTRHAAGYMKGPQ